MRPAERLEISESLSANVASASFWHINADEPSAIDYNEEGKAIDLYINHAFRSAAHDPLILGLDFNKNPPNALFIPLITK